MTGGASFRFGEFTLDPSARRLEREGVEVTLQPQVYATLLYLLENAGRIVTKDELLSSLWPDAVVGEASLTRCVSQLRQALGDGAKQSRFVKTVPRVGFRFVATVEAAGEARGTDTSIAVLPFRPLLLGERDESLELGMAETLIARLSGVPGLVVRSLGTVRRYAGLELDPLVAGRELRVDAIVEGSLQRLEDRARVTVRVLNVADGRALVAERYDEPARDVFAVQDAICRRIAGAVSLEVGSGEASGRAVPGTEDPEAYRHYLQGRLALGSMSPEGALRSLSHFERALSEDPRYAEALVSSAEAYIIQATPGIDVAAHYAEARKAARAALEIDEQLGGAWGCLATVAFQFDWDWAEAERCFSRAVALAPKVVDIWCSYSGFCALTGRRDEAVALARRALEVDPVSPMAGAWLAQALHMAGRWDEAIAAADDTLARAPGFPFALFFRGLACAALGRADEAVDWLAQAARVRPDFAGMLGFAYLSAGREKEAERLQSLLTSAIEAGQAPPIALAPFHAARGDADRFFEVLEQTYDRRGWHVLLLPFEPIFEPYRSDARALELVRRLGLPSGAP